MSARRLSVALILASAAFSRLGCTFDWDVYDPRLGASSPDGSAGGGVAGSSGSGGTSGSGATGGTAGVGATGGVAGTGATGGSSGTGATGGSGASGGSAGTGATGGSSGTGATGGAGATGGGGTGGGGGLVADWPFDDGTGTTVQDASGHGHDGVFNGTWDTGKVSGAGVFNGSSQFVSVAASNDFARPAGASLTISAWVYRSGSLSHNILASAEYGPSKSCFGLELESDSTLTYWDGVSHVAETTISLPANTWHYIAVTVANGTLATLYFDGSPVGSNACDNTPRTTPNGFRIGGDNWGAFFPGRIDRVRYYQRALSAAEVPDDMNK